MVWMSERRIYLGIGAPRLVVGWVLIAEYVMTIPDNEVLGPEHLDELGALFDKTWTAFEPYVNGERQSEDRTQLACILLRLYGLRQLGPDQLAQTALRLMKQSSPVGATAEASGRQFQPADCSASVPKFSQ
jgi:hypothetical protein